MLSLENITLSVEDKIVLSGFSLDLRLSRLTLLVGPNGSGKSSLVNYLLGDPLYKKILGTSLFDCINLDELSTVDRARAGLFVVCQHQVEIPGLTVTTFLKAIHESLVGPVVDVGLFLKEIEELFVLVGLDLSFLERSVHEGFSGGQKKRFEMVQALLCRPKCIIFDEIDSGLDEAGSDILLTVIDRLFNESGARACLIVTHRPELFTSFEHALVSVVKR